MPFLRAPRLRLLALSAVLELFAAAPPLAGQTDVTFALNPDGSIDQIRMAPTSPAVDFSFDLQDVLLRPVEK